MRVSILIAIVIVLVALASGASAQAPGTSFRDCADCPEMVVVPAGTFTMGVPAGEEEREGLPERFSGRSTPQTRVSINSAFAMGRSHMTRGEFASFVRATNYQSAGCYTFVADRDPQWQLNATANWSSPGFAQSDQHPVVCVSWDDAQAYVRWLSSRTGRWYRLPSEAEWEYAARAGTTTARFWGDAPEEACAYANVSDLTAAEALNLARTPDSIHVCRDGHVYTAPVASFRPNQFNLYDMLGNAWEWVEDCWNANYAGRPTDQSAWLAGNCSGRVARGGSWRYPPRSVRAGLRGWRPSDDRSYFAGFRVARTLTP
jgi:formylglycine-generating enzyme required for sulfatase activity